MLGYGLDGPDSIPGIGGVEIFSSLLRVQTDPGVYSAFYKISTGEVMAAERRTKHPSS